MERKGIVKKPLVDESWEAPWFDAAYYWFLAFLSISSAFTPLQVDFVAIPLLTAILASMLFLLFGLTVSTAKALYYATVWTQDTSKTAASYKNDMEETTGWSGVVMVIGGMAVAGIFFNLDFQTRASLLSPLGAFFTLVGILQLAYDTKKLKKRYESTTSNARGSWTFAAIFGIACGFATMFAFIVTGFLRMFIPEAQAYGIALACAYALIAFAMPKIYGTVKHPEVS